MMPAASRVLPKDRECLRQIGIAVLQEAVKNAIKDTHQGRVFLQGLGDHAEILDFWCDVAMIDVEAVKHAARAKWGVKDTMTSVVDSVIDATFATEVLKEVK